MRSLFSPFIVALLLSAAAPLVQAQEACYMAVLSAQRPDVNRPKYTHTFAVFAKTRWCNGSCRLEAFTISWLPRAGVVQPVRLLPEPGLNYDLHTTIRLVQAEGERVSLWGPYEIQPELYQRALAQKAHLESGRVLYKAVDTGWPASRVSNCIHGVSDMTGEGSPLRIASPGWGDPASYYVTLHLLPRVVNPCVTHEWVFDALGLRNACIYRRGLREGNPSPSAALRAFMAVVQCRLEKRARCLLAECPPLCRP